MFMSNAIAQQNGGSGMGFVLFHFVMTPAFVQSLGTAAYSLALFVYQNGGDHQAIIVKVVAEIQQVQALHNMYFQAVLNATGGSLSASNNCVRIFLPFLCFAASCPCNGSKTRGHLINRVHAPDCHGARRARYLFVRVPEPVVLRGFARITHFHLQHPSGNPESTPDVFRDWRSYGSTPSSIPLYSHGEWLCELRIDHSILSCS
eukprot:COSAG02_NODE_5401_length_4361_cov_3.564054_1_plen_204_part_00